MISGLGAFGGAGDASNQIENLLAQLRSQESSFQLRLILSTIKSESLPNVGLIMNLRGALDVVANPRLAMKVANGFLPLMSELSEIDMDALYTVAVSACSGILSQQKEFELGTWIFP